MNDKTVTAPPRITPKSTRQYRKKYADGGPVGDLQFPQLKPQAKIPQFSWEPLLGGGIHYKYRKGGAVRGEENG
jgi:hypothetical protein